jgi:hypothetical protein
VTVVADKSWFRPCLDCPRTIPADSPDLRCARCKALHDAKTAPKLHWAMRLQPDLTVASVTRDHGGFEIVATGRGRHQMWVLRRAGVALGRVFRSPAEAKQHAELLVQPVEAQGETVDTRRTA